MRGSVVNVPTLVSLVWLAGSHALRQSRLGGETRDGRAGTFVRQRFGLVATLAVPSSVVVWD